MENRPRDRLRDAEHHAKMMWHLGNIEMLLILFFIMEIGKWVAELAPGPIGDTLKFYTAGAAIAGLIIVVVRNRRNRAKNKEANRDGE